MRRGGDQQRRKPTMKRQLLIVVALKRERKKVAWWIVVAVLKGQTRRGCSDPPTGEKEPEQADNEKRRQLTEKEAHNEEAVVGCGIEEGKEEGSRVDCCGSVEAEEADNESTTRPINNEEGKEEECECVEMPKSPSRQKQEPAAEAFFI
jgi:hypothetical protein